MRKALVITNYTDETDAQLIGISSAVIKGCEKNADIKFVDNELTDLIAANADFSLKLSLASTGSKASITLKKRAKKVLAQALKTVCKEINHQQKGNKAILISTGATMAKNSNSHKSGLLPIAENLTASWGSQLCELIVKVKKIKGLNNNGTVFAYTEFEDANDEIGTWNKDHSTCHSMTLTGLKKGTAYQVSAAYKGTNSTPYNWCSPIIVYTKPG